MVSLCFLGMLIIFFQSTTSGSPTTIPRLVDNSGGNFDPSGLNPSEWNVFEVAQFLRVNDCANYCDAFSKQVGGFQQN